MMKLYSYWRSSAAYRVRIALALKQIPYDYIPVSLIANGGEHRAASYAEKNPQNSSLSSSLMMAALSLNHSPLSNISITWHPPPVSSLRMPSLEPWLGPLRSPLRAKSTPSTTSACSATLKIPATLANQNEPPGIITG